jgi:hypothetical protein
VLVLAEALAVAAVLAVAEDSLSTIHKRYFLKVIYKTKILSQ